MASGGGRLPHARQLAEFVVSASWDGLSPEARQALRVRVLDALGCALGALDGAPVARIRRHVEEFGGRPLCTLIGGGRTAPDRAALYNSSLVRYLDFNDSYLAPGETCHPSDNLGAVLAATEYAGGSGRDLLTALAVAYQVQCRLSDVAPVRARGFDHVTQGAFSVAAGASRALGLDADRTAQALAIAGTAYNALRVTRTGRLSHWKGLAFPNCAAGALHAAFLARQGITGPAEVFEGNKGWRETVSGPWDLDWSKERLERVTATDLKKYNAEIHSQSAIEGLLELLEGVGIAPSQIREIRVAIFDVAYHIIGGGEEGDKTLVQTKEEADHSLPYLLAVAALDGTVLPAQYAPQRIVAPDVQDLLRRVRIQPDPDYTRRFPAEHACRVAVLTRDGGRHAVEKTAYEGFHTTPMRWETVERKFRALARGRVAPAVLDRLVEVIGRLEEARLPDLLDPLARCGGGRSEAT